MKKTFLSPLFLSRCFLILLTLFADLNGKWTGTIITPEGEQIQPVYTFKVAGDSLTGTAEIPGQMLTIDDGKIKGDDFSFKVTVEGTDYPHTGRVYNDSCSLDIEFGPQKVHTTLKRVTQ